MHHQEGLCQLPVSLINFSMHPSYLFSETAAGITALDHRMKHFITLLHQPKEEFY
jgi:hypothetical protein